MHLSHIPQCTIQNRNVHISVLNGALWDMGQVHCWICEFGLFQWKLNENWELLWCQLGCLWWDHWPQSWHHDNPWSCVFLWLIHWLDHYNSSCFQRVCIIKRNCYNQNLILVCTLKQNSGGTSCGFTNIKSNWNMSRSGWKWSAVHTYWLNQSKWTFST